MHKILTKAIKIIQICFIVCFLILTNLLFYNYVNSNKISEKSGEEYLEREEYNFSDIFQDENDYIEQKFHPIRPELENIRIRLAINHANLPYDFTILIEFCEGDQVLKREEITNKQIKNWTYYNFEIARKLDMNQEYSIRIRQIVGPKDEKSEKYLISYVIFHAVKHVLENETCYFYNGEQVEGEFEVSYVYSYIDKELILKQIIVNILFIAGLFIFYLLKKKLQISDKIKRRIVYILYFLLPIFAFISVEIITGYISTIIGWGIIKNILLYYLLLAVLSFIVKKFGHLSVIYFSICFILAFIQYFVSLFRGRVFMIQDIYSWKTATTVANTYHYQIPYEVFIILIVCIFFICICSSIEIKILLKYKIFMTSACMVCIIGITMLGKSKYLLKINMWDLEGNYKSGGLLLTLISEIPYLVGEKPETYSIEKVESIIDEVYCVEGKQEIIPENILLIMNESFADLEYIDEISSNAELLPHIKSINKNVIKGYLHVPVFGAGTANTEYEVLTGNSMSFLVGGSTAYQMNVFDNEYSLVSTLKEQNYDAYALHPYLAENWNRKIVYQYMGFGNFLSGEDWKEIEYLRWCASDRTAYNKLIEIDQKTDGMFFAFLVTMQNHGGYASEWDNFKNTIELDYKNDYPQAEQYLSLLQESDRAFQELIEYFSNIEEPTMIVMFGDHQASIEEEFYAELFGKPLKDLSFEEKQERYVTPFIIWTNYDIEENDHVRMSTNYFGSYILSIAGLELTPYNQFLLELWREIPVIGYGGICDKDGIWYQWNEIPEYYVELLEEYKILQYNNVYDRSNRIEEIFTVK